MGFISYFLIVWDFVNYAKKNDIPVGPGRGSAAGSLIAFLLGITNVDPLKNGLLFERFLNPARVSMPDIDIDFCYDRRLEVIEYVRHVYGQLSVAQIITFGTLAARVVIRDVGRVMGIPFPKVDQIAKMIPAEPKMTLKKALEVESGIRDLIKEDREVEALFNNAQKLEGLPRNTSTHAAGIIISQGELTDKVALYKGQNNEVITQFDGPSCEKIGLLKMDFLGLRTLTVLDNALKRVNESKKTAEKINIDEISMNDPLTYELSNIYLRFFSNSSKAPALARLSRVFLFNALLSTTLAKSSREWKLCSVLASIIPSQALLPTFLTALKPYLTASFSTLKS